MAEKMRDMNFNTLISSIRQVHEQLSAQAGRAVNIRLTMRNSAIGYYIREYEQSGADRATYGETLMDKLAERLQSEGMKRVAARELRRYRRFYMVYPQIWESATTEFQNYLPHTLLQLPAPIRSLALPVSLAEIKADSRLAGIGLVRQPRLAVMPLTAQVFDIIANDMVDKSMELGMYFSELRLWNFRKFCMFYSEVSLCGLT